MKIGSLEWVRERRVLRAKRRVRRAVASGLVWRLDGSDYFEPEPYQCWLDVYGPAAAYHSRLLNAPQAINTYAVRGYFD